MPHDSSRRDPQAVGQDSLDLEPVIEAVGRTLKGSVADQQIRDCVQRLMSERYADARVPNFVPVFLHRAACESLRMGSRPAA
jgi:hypothetical protein